MRASSPIVFAAMLVSSPGVTGVQDRDCVLDVQTAPGSESRYVRLPDGERRLDVRGAVEGTCGPRWVRADSAQYYEQRGELRLYDHVRYRDDQRTLESQRATYYARQQHVRAEGDVRLADRDGGSMLTGPVLDYYPRTDGRPVERIVATGRPHLTVRREAGDSVDATAPLEVDADRIHLYGDSLFAASRRVVATREDLTAYGDSMELDLQDDRLWLVGEPRIQTGNLTLEGDTISGVLADNQIRELRAWPAASAAGEDLQLDGPALRLFIDRDQVERVVAARGVTTAPAAADGPARPDPWVRSESRDYVLVADSLDIRRPNGRLQKVIAVDRARASSKAPPIEGDTLLGRDWLEGDTIVGHFEPPDSGSVGARPVALRKLVASSNARALYHLRGEKTQEGGRRAVNYVLGRIVTIWLSESEVEDVEVVGPSTGVYLEPVADGVGPDTTRTLETAVSDSLSDADSVAADTLSSSSRGGT